ncbi:centrosomal protein of 95 kDa-like, partial [Entelurus aequoreus]|uniref:centrosomal protein of 95 kDa-like n=1 Tax=Entelurus aequoreus TaxID=161455 RepID=UPI002B1E0650
RDFKEHAQQQKSTQNRLRDQRQQVARARKYHQDYHVQHRARLMKARTKEEKMFRQLFEEGLEMQKSRLREQRDYATEQRQQHHRQHQDHIQSMENYYRDQVGHYTHLFNNTAITPAAPRADSAKLPRGEIAMFNASKKKRSNVSKVESTFPKIASSMLIYISFATDMLLISISNFTRQFQHQIDCKVHFS